MIINQIIFDEIMKHDKTKDKVEVPKVKEEFMLDKEGKPISEKMVNQLKTHSSVRIVVFLFQKNIRVNLFLKTFMSG